MSDPIFNLDFRENFSDMPGFARRGSALFCEEIAVEDLACRFGTPLYIYSYAALQAALADWLEGVKNTRHRIFYAIKANGNLALLDIMRRAGIGFDIVSTGELKRALTVGAEGKNIVYSGVGKSREDIRFALEAGICCFNAESIPEIERINEAALAMGVQAPVSFRVNPDVNANTHPYISTGLKSNKFGIAYDKVVEIYRYAATLKGIRISGIDCHIGSQISEIEPFVHAADKLMDLLDEVSESGIELDHIDFGGGLGVRYTEETPPTARELVEAVTRRVALRGYSDIPVYFEPGRSLIARAGVLATRVEYLKPTDAKNFCIVDAAMNDMIRPTLYSAQMTLENALERTDEPEVWDVVGPVCETGDFLARDRKLAVKEGDVLVMSGAGAYGMSMASNYNTRPRAAEVLIKGENAWLIRRRETFEDMIRLESTVPAVAL